MFAKYIIIVYYIFFVYNLVCYLFTPLLTDKDFSYTIEEIFSQASV